MTFIKQRHWRGSEATSFALLQASTQIRTGSVEMVLIAGIDDRRDNNRGERLFFYPMESGSRKNRLFCLERRQRLKRV